MNFRDMPLRLGLTRIFFCAGAACGLFACGQAEKPPFELTTISPDKSYQVRLQEHVEEPVNPFSKHGRTSVRLTVSTGGTELVDDWFYGGGSLDSRFSNLYPRYEWASNSILHFLNGDFSQSPRDEVYIYNDTAQDIRYLTVIADSDRFLVLDLQHRSGAKVTCAHSQDGLSWVSCRGKFSHGDDIPEGGANFRTGPEINSPIHYCLSIESHGVSVQSMESEGFKYVDGKRTTVRKAAKCVFHR